MGILGGEEERPLPGKSADLTLWQQAGPSPPPPPPPCPHTSSATGGRGGGGLHLLTQVPTSGNAGSPPQLPKKCLLGEGAGAPRPLALCFPCSTPPKARKWEQPHLSLPLPKPRRPQLSLSAQNVGWGQLRRTGIGSCQVSFTPFPPHPAFPTLHDAEWRPAVMGCVPAGGVGATGSLAEGAVLGRDAGEVRHGDLPG